VQSAGFLANTFKGVKNYRFELFYWDYAVGIFLTSLIFAFTLGSSGNNSSSFLNNVHAADASNIGWALLAGVIFNLANCSWSPASIWRVWPPLFCRHRHRPVVGVA